MRNIKKLMAPGHITAAICLLLAVITQKAIAASNGVHDSIPKPVVPVYNKLKPLYIRTELVASSKPAITIYAPGAYAALGTKIQAAVKKKTGITIPMVNSIAAQPSVPLKSNLILLGNRSTNNVISKLYDRGFTYLDLKYPGNGGYVVRSLHNPYGNGYNVLFAGGSDAEGVARSATELIKLINEARIVNGNLGLGYVSVIKLSPAYTIPDNSRKAEIWEASKQYNSDGYFGWNSVSKYMALFYMTGEEKYLKEFLRLSFPDSNAIKEMELADGELIENKKDPLAGPYHYGAYMMIGLWDLIEESPLLNDEIRLKITNAFARQLTHRVVEYGSIYSNTEAPAFVGDRHNDWAAISLYVLALYFQRDYPGSVWEHSIKAADLHFSALKKTTWTAGNNDHLFWFTSFYDPMINYLIFSGNRDTQTLANLRKVLRTQEIIYTGNVDDWGLKASSVSMLNKAAYLLNDGRWLYFRERNGVNTDVFRLGQSFWPGNEFKAKAPADLKDKWTMEWMQREMWQRRSTDIPLNASFRWGSYRSSVNEEGDLILLKGYNGAGRNPYHSFALLELRLNGTTLLKGYHNQVLTSADGMVEPQVAMDAALLYQGETGEVVGATGEVKKLPFVNWKRTLALRKSRFAVIADELTFRTDTDNLYAETSWETPGASWDADGHFLKIHTPQKGASSSGSYQLHSSEDMNVKAGKVTLMNWRGVAKKGQRKVFFHLLGESPENNNNKSTLVCLKLADNAAVMALPEASIAVAGNYRNVNGELVLLSEHALYGRELRTAGMDQSFITSDEATDVYWDFKSGKLILENKKPVKVLLSLASPVIYSKGKKFSGQKVKGQYQFIFPSGKQEISNAFPVASVLKKLESDLRNMLDSRRKAEAIRYAQKTNESNPDVLPLTQVIRTNIGKAPVESIVIPSADGDLFCIASGNLVTVLNSEGKQVRKLETKGNVKVLRWWAEAKLLLVGCDDELVVAFDENGKRKWAFTSVMDHEVYEAGKQYWFKSAYPGVHGLYSGVFDNGKSRAFVGSACTLEIIDEDGKLVKRLPVFWSVIKQFLMLDDADGSKKLLVGGSQSGMNELVVIGSKTLSETGRGYTGVPEGHSFVGGWMNMNRFDNFLIDLDKNGEKEVVSAINGTWNRITIYTASGKPLYNVQFGPGVVTPRANLRMMDVGDIDDNGEPEIIVALSSGLVDVFDAKANKLWARSLSSAPVVAKLVKEAGGNWICIGSEDGTIIAMDAKGKILRGAKVGGRPVDLQVMQSPGGPLAYITTDQGEVTGFRMSKQQLLSNLEKTSSPN